MKPLADCELSHRLDRLACGELGEADRVTLFEWLDAEPTRWRRCALGLLEAQLWGEACDLVRSTEAGPFAQRTTPMPKCEIQTRRWPRRLATAATLVTVFLLGLFASDVWWGRSDSVHNRAANKRGDGAPDRAIATRPILPSNRNSKSSGSTAITNSVSSTGKENATPTRSLTIRSEHGDELKLPVVECPVHAQDIISQPPKLPDYILNQWEKKGYQVKQSRHYIPLEVNDGKRLVIPVEQYQMRYIGNASS